MMDGKTSSLAFTEQKEKCLALASLRESQTEAETPYKITA